MVRIKVRNILLILGVIAIGWIFFHFTLPNVLYRTAWVFEKIGKPEWANVYYEKISETYEERSVAMKAQVKKIQLAIKEHNLVYFSDRYTSSGGGSGKNGYTVSYASIDSINETYKELEQNGKSQEDMGKYTLGVAIMNWFAGNWQRAIGLLEDQNIEYDEELRWVKDLNLAAMYLGVGNREEAERVLGRIKSGDKGAAYLIEDLRLYNLVLQNDKKGFLANYDQNENLIYRNEALDAIDSPYLEPVKELHSMLWDAAEQYKNEEKMKGNNTVKGKVTMNGAPMTGMLVYLLVSDDWGVFTSGHSIPYCSYMAFTDENGEYVLNQVPVGIYNLGFSGDWQRVQGKNIEFESDSAIVLKNENTITRDISFHNSIEVKVKTVNENEVDFQWDEIQDADYYVIWMGELRESEKDERAVVQNNYVSERIYATEYHFDIEEERKNAMTGGFAWSDEKVIVSTVLDPLYHEGEYAYHVVGMKDGRIVGDSDGIYPNAPHDTIHIQGYSWTKADEFLLGEKFEEAVFEYENAIQKDPDNIHALKMLAALYSNGWRTEDGWENRIGKNPEKAIRYYEKLERLLSQKQDVRNHLASLYEKIGAYDKAIACYQKLIEEDHPSSYQFAALGNLYIQQGRIQEAKITLEAGYKVEETEYIQESMIMLYLMIDDIEGLKKIGEEYLPSHLYADYTSIFNKYEKMDRYAYEPFYKDMREDQIEKAKNLLDNREDDLSKLYKGIFALLEYDGEKREEEYISLYSRIKDQDIKLLMQDLGKANIRSNFGVEGEWE